jgi:hypothetical protein
MFKRVAFVQLANSFVSGLVSKIYQTMSICTMTLETVWKIYPRRWHLNGNSYSKRLFHFKLDFIPICPSVPWTICYILTGQYFSLSHKYGANIRICPHMSVFAPVFNFWYQRSGLKDIYFAIKVQGKMMHKIVFQ